MKKVILGAAALLFTGVLFAQNTSTSSQSGDDQRVYVRQAGTELSSDITQGNGSGSGHNRAMVMQRGDGNSSAIDQEGTSNQAYVDQANFTPPTDAQAVINQGKTNTASANNKARIEQHGGTGSITTINQDGDKNEARAHQDDTGSTITVTQNGNKNRSLVYQLPFYASSNNLAEIVQTGDENCSTAAQDGEDNELYATQIGDKNKADQAQEGDGNYASVYQEADENTARQHQDGDGNVASAVQHAITGLGQFNYVEQNQTGDDNEAYSDQDGWGGYVRQDQTGNDNYAEANQYAAGSGNKIYQRQFGSNNSITSMQYSGSDNKVATYQDDDNVGTTWQAGNGNHALLVQKSQGGAGHIASIAQNGNGNMADVLQLGPDGDWSADGENCFFPDPVPVDCPPLLTNIDIGDPCPGC